MEKPATPKIDQIYQALQRLIGLHRQLLDNVRLERKALVDADLKAIQEATVAKQALIEGIHQAEAARQKLVPAITLSALIMEIQGSDLKLSEQFRTAQNALTILIQRITEQNDDNRALVEKSLRHVNEMKKNVLGESVPKSNTYNQQGQKSGTARGARMLSREA
jgi:hypothetical protein